MSWAKENEEHCNAAPTTIIDDPKSIVFLRPSMSPIHIVAIAPKKQPTLYDPIEIPNLNEQDTNRNIRVCCIALYSRSMSNLRFGESTYVIGGIDLWEDFGL